MKSNEFFKWVLQKTDSYWWFFLYELFFMLIGLFFGAVGLLVKAYI